MSRNHSRVVTSRRNQGTKIVNKVILYCEGRNTEPSYFELLKKNNCKVVPVVVPGHGIAYDSESKAVEEDFFDLMMAIHPETHNQRLLDAYNRAKTIHETKRNQGAEFAESVTTMYELMKELGVVRE